MTDALWFAGIDAGGTATKAWLYRRGVGFAARGTGRSGNILTVGADGVAGAARDALTEAAALAGLDRVPPLARVAAAVAGARRHEEKELGRAALVRALGTEHVQVHPDAAAALIGGTLGEPGVAVVAGTGSAAWGLTTDGEWVRRGGWGYLLGDEGSGFDLGLQALRSAVRAADGRGPKSPLHGALLRGLGLDDPQELIPFAYGGAVPKARIAALAPLVLAAWDREDSVASPVVVAALHELVDLAHACLSAGSIPAAAPVVAVGGLFTHVSFFSAFRSKLAVGGREVVHPELEPAAGACIMALQAASSWNARERELLRASYAAKHAASPST